jgi:serine/threonine protein kinase
MSDTISKEAKNLLTSILQVDADRRPTAKEILNSEWMQKQTRKDEEDNKISERLES